MRAIRQFMPNELLKLISIISLNGAITHINGDVVKLSSLDDISKSIIAEAESLDKSIVSVEFFGEEFGTNMSFSGQELLEYQSATPDMVIPINEIDYSKVSKIAIDGCGSDLLFFRDKISNSSIKIISALDDTFLNIVEAGVDKSSTLLSVCSKLNVDMKDIAVFGDDVPDIEMMKIAGISVAMGNSKSFVKECADIVIGDCDSNAIAEFINSKIS